jgi:hypothetical protein
MASALPVIQREMIPRHVTVRTRSDHIAISFSYVSPQMARLAFAILGIVSILVILCFASDALDVFVASTSRWVPALAETYIPPVYAVYRGFLDLISGVIAPFVPPEVLSVAAALVAFFGLALLRTTLEANHWEVTLLSPILGSRQTVRFYPEQTKIGARAFPRAEDQRFELLDSAKTRNRKKRAMQYDLSKEIVFRYGTTPVSVANIFGIDKAAEIQAALSYVDSSFDY